MPWFWGKGKNDDDDDDEYSSYDSSESASFVDDSDEDDGQQSFEEVDPDDDEDVGPPKLQPQEQSVHTNEEEEEDRRNASNEGLRRDELVELLRQPQHPPQPAGAAPPPLSSTTSQHGGSLTSHDDDPEDELLPTLPAAVAARRARTASTTSSALSSGDDDEDDDDDEEHDDPGPREDDNNRNHKAHESPVFQSDTTKAATTTVTDENEEEDQEDDEEVTSLVEKQSLLLLAAENDRVDILQAILASSSSSPNKNNNNHNNTTSDETTNINNNDNTEREFLLNPVTSDGIVTTIPPLHIAVSYGSINTINCLLRLGANPSLRPNVSIIRTLQQQQQSNNTAVELPHLHRFDGWSAWELAFGKSSSSSTSANPPDEDPVASRPNTKSRTGWLFRGGSKSGSLDDSNSARSSCGSLQLPPSKQESIRHAFTAEALRCLGSDEVERLRQLLQAGMPPDTEIGHQTLWDWAVDWNATQCQLELQQQQQQLTANSSGVNGTRSTAETNSNNSNGPLPTDSSSSSHPHQTAVLDRRVASSQHDENNNNNDTHTTAALVNRLDELESLARALSECLDHLAEEVSVCTGLLLVGSGAAALASHVRSLKATRQRKYDEWVWVTQAGEQALDELAYWKREYGIPATEAIHWTADVPGSLLSSSGGSATPESPSGADPTANDSEMALQQQQQLQVQIGAMEHKIRMLRASIADLSEENVRNLAKVERRGLSGGIALVRGLRDEIREIEFELAESKRSEAACQAQLALLQSRMKHYKKNPPPAATTTTTNGFGGGAAHGGDGLESRSVDDPRSTQASSEPTVELEKNVDDESNDQDYGNIPESERIATGQSTALIVRPADQRRGFLPYHLWRIFLRIMGLSDDEAQLRDAVASSSAAPVVMIL